MITDLIAAASSNVPFRLAWKRVRCIRRNHRNYALKEYTLIDKLTSEAHPHTDAEYLYTVNILRCDHCGLTYLDPGLEYRKELN